MARIIELKWDCKDCETKSILGRHKRCPNCGSPREKGEMRMSGLNTDKNKDGYNDAATVTDPELLKQAKAGADWFCSHCGSGNIGNGEQCTSCGSPRYGVKEEDHPDPQHAVRKQRVAESGSGRPSSRLPSPPNPSQEAWREEEKLRAAQQAQRKEERQQREEAELAEQLRQQKRKDRNIKLAAGGGVIAIGFLLWFFYWASQTHEVLGSVIGSTWTHVSAVETWTTYTKREWERDVSLRPEIKPVKGRGERAGMALLGGCEKEHHHYEEYQCGTKEESYECGSNESYSSTCSETESYVCGETCSDNGNGFATCRDKHCSRSISVPCTKTRYVSKTCQRTVPKYCDRSIKYDKCNYATQKWQTAYTKRETGSGIETRWPLINLDSLQREVRTATYSVQVRYTDAGETGIHEEDLDSLAEYIRWVQAPAVYVYINNLGGVSDVSLQQVKK